MNIHGIHGMSSLSLVDQTKAATHSTEESQEGPAEKARELAAQTVQQKSNPLHNWQGTVINMNV
jgi:hypothetical protein